MAIPHNSNVSDGKMFDKVSYDGSPLTEAYAQQRIRNKPIVEMTQVKGTSETHPALSPNDELTNFEIYEKLLGSNITSKINGGFVREALANGLAIEKNVGTNPYKFGMIGPRMKVRMFAGDSAKGILEAADHPATDYSGHADGYFLKTST